MIDNIQQLEAELARIEKETKGKEQERELREAMAQYHGDDEVLPFNEIWEDIKNAPETRFSIGMPELDAVMGGIDEGDLIVLTAPTGQGKTTFCQHLTNSLSKEGQKSLWFSFEVSLKRFLQKFDGQFPMGYSPKTNQQKSLVWLERKMIEGLVKFQTKIVFIDHLDFVINATGENEAFEIKQVMHELKAMAIKYKVTIFLVAHIKAQEDGQIVSINSLKGSSSISQLADFVICMWRVPQKQGKESMKENGIILTNETVVSIVKNRPTGQQGSFKMVYNDGRFMPQLTKAKIL